MAVEGAAIRSYRPDQPFPALAALYSLAAASAGVLGGIAEGRRPAQDIAETALLLKACRTLARHIEDRIGPEPWT